METMIGKVRLLSTGQYEFWRADGIVRGIEETDAPIETPLEVSIENDRVVHWRRDDTQPAAYRDAVRKIIAFCGMAESEDEAARIRPRVERGAKDHQDWLRFVGAGHWDPIIVRPFVFIVDDKSDYRIHGDWDHVRELVREADPAHEYNYFHVTNVYAGSGNAGIAYVSSDRCITYDPLNRSARSHEQFHTFGRNHDTAPTLMASGHGTLRTAAAGMHRIGLMDPAHVVHVSEGEVFLVPPGSRPRAIEVGEHRVAYGPSGSVEFDGDTVHVRTGRGTPPWNAVQQVATLRAPGDEAEGVTFRGVERGAARVAIGSAGRGPVPGLNLPDDRAPIADQVGIWHHRAWNHQGLDLHVTDDGRVVGYVYAWDERGHPRWFMIQGKHEDDHAQAPLYTVAPDNWNRQLDRVGTALLYFHDDDRGVLKLDIDFGRLLVGRFAMPLARLSTPAEHELYGVYGLDGKTHEGLSVTVNQPVEPDKPLHVAGYHYTHQGESSRMWSPWRYFEGPVGEALTVYEPRGGYPLIESPSTLEPVGEARLTPETYAFDGQTHQLNELV